ncbi:hypothetical protein [Amycolatopsis sp. cmx-4-83]|uniref:hypothetical protein n=1 Tax=Amycolatopsis sp. cmx-4-83 TaxID=2790940 RepID=UPI00397CD964
MTAAAESRGIWLAPDWSGLAIEAEDGSLIELGREHGYGAWVSQGMLDAVPDHWLRLVATPAEVIAATPGCETEWGRRWPGTGIVQEFGHSRQDAEDGAFPGTELVCREVGPWTGVQP